MPTGAPRLRDDTRVRELKGLSALCEDCRRYVDALAGTPSVGHRLRPEVPMRFDSRRSFLVLGVAALGATLVAARDVGDSGDRPATARPREATYGMRVAP